MTHTPRTDAQNASFPMGGFTLDFCCQHERELTDAIRQRDEARGQIEANHAATLVLERMVYEAREECNHAIAALTNIHELEMETGTDPWATLEAIGTIAHNAIFQPDANKNELSQ
jgi:hypothetical protein